MQKNIPEPISDNSGDPAVVRQRQQAGTIRQPLGDGAFLFWEGVGEGLFPSRQIFGLLWRWRDPFAPKTGPLQGLWGGFGWSRSASGADPRTVILVYRVLVYRKGQGRCEFHLTFTCRRDLMQLNLTY